MDKFKDGLAQGPGGAGGIFGPMLAQPGDLGGNNDTSASLAEPTLTKEFDERLRIQERQSQSSFPSSSYGNEMPQEEEKPNHKTKSKPERPVYAIDNKYNDGEEEGEEEDENEEDDNDEYDSDDYDFDDDEDDPVLAAIRQKRIAELKRQQLAVKENKSKGHGEYRVITQDEFLPECTGSKWVVVHFFHNDFERCKIMDHHLKIIAKLHLKCKFVAVDAAKTPFFVQKLQVKTLPTVIVFKDGKAIDRLIGFDGLSSSSKNPDEFTTSSLGRWLESAKAIEYEGPDSDDEDNNDENNRNRNSRGGAYQSRFHNYDEDN